MILRATFENIYSIKDETQISFVAGKSNAHPSHVSRAEKRDDISVLKAGIVYGANASGKSKGCTKCTKNRTKCKPEYRISYAC